MIWLVLFPVLFAIFSFKEIFHHANSFLGYCSAAFFWVCGSGFAFLVGLLFATIVGLIFKKHWGNPIETELVSLRDRIGATGQFFLGSGYIESAQYYFFYKKHGTGFTPEKIQITSNVVVYEQDRKDGLLKTYQREFTENYPNLFAVVWSTKYEFFIPNGSLKKDFVL